MAGNIARRPDGAWRARYRDARGNEHAQHFDRKIDAQRWLASVEITQARGEWLDPARARVRIGEWSQTWLQGQVQLKPSTRARYELAVRRQVLPSWQSVPLAAVTYADVAVWVQQLAASGLAPATVRYAHRVLSLILQYAVRDGRLPRNPAHGVQLPRVVTNQKRFLSHEQSQTSGSNEHRLHTVVGAGASGGSRNSSSVERVRGASRVTTVGSPTCSKTASTCSAGTGSLKPSIPRPPRTWSRLKSSGTPPPASGPRQNTSPVPGSRRTRGPRRPTRAAKPFTETAGSS